MLVSGRVRVYQPLFSLNKALVDPYLKAWCFCCLSGVVTRSMLIATMDESSSIAPTLRVTAVTGVVGIVSLKTPPLNWDELGVNEWMICLR